MRRSSLSSRVRDAFDPRVRVRGEGYAARDRVSLRSVRGAVHAAVQGSREHPYDVIVAAPDPSTLRLECSCPFADGLEPCKHMWAVLVACDEEGVGPRLAGHGPVDLIVSNGVEEETLPAPADGWDGDDRSIEEGSPSSEPRMRRAGGAAPGWRSRLRALEAPDPVDFDVAARPASLEFVLDPARSPADALAVRLMRRRPLAGGALSAPRPVRSAQWRTLVLSDQDRDLCGLLEATGRAGYSSDLLLVPAPLLPLILPRLCATGRARLDETPDAVRWDEGEPFEPVVELRRDERGGVVAHCVLKRGDERAARVDFACGGVALLSHRFVRLAAEPAVELTELNGLRAPRSEADAFVAAWTKLCDLPPLWVDPALGWHVRRGSPAPIARFLRPEHASRTEVRLSFDYGPGEVGHGDRRGLVCDRKTRTLFERDRAAEGLALERLRELGVTIAPQPGRRDGTLPLGALPAVAGALVAEGWRVEAEGRALRSASNLSMKVSSGIDWFDLEVAVEFGGASVELAVLLDALRRKERFVLLGDGSCGMLPEDWLERYAPLVGGGTVAGDRLRFSRCQACILDALLALAPEVDVDARFEAARRELAAFDRIEPLAPPRSFQGTLRPYQELGLGWLAFLERLGLGGVLADDMGLGKTVQVLAHLAGRRRGKPSIVVAPKSVVANWRDEAARFAPSLRVLDYTGPERRAAAVAEHDLVLTTYGTLRRDIEELHGVRFEYAILDEAQNVKNPKAQAAKAARLIAADHRLALTGTPIENGLDDLASILDFLAPGLVSGTAQLRALATARAPSGDGLQLLRRALRPLVLRRTKQEVLRELPAKTEHTVRCPLDRRQRKLYDGLRAHYRAALKRRIERQGMSRAKIHVLEALLRLRQAACHPGLLDEAQRGEPSAKLEVLLERLVEVAESGHKALVFSQFTSFLGIVRARLDAHRIPFAYLDGQTSAAARKREVGRFQTDAGCRAFLVSLKAGGTGLNLTAADYVFLLDPWWNPAVEAQAVDRSHRIGQTRPVFAYRLVAEDTVEEKVLELQQRKRVLADSLLGGEESLLRGLTADDLDVLLR
jgi:superfamily II DNA or RNA helicase